MSTVSSCPSIAGTPNPFTAKDAEDAKEGWDKPENTTRFTAESAEIAEQETTQSQPPTPWRDPFEVRTDVSGATPIPDEPWRVRIVRPEEEKGFSDMDEWRAAARARMERVQPWRAGDLARLKDDTPKGVLKYVATHTDSIWGQLAAKALLDADRLEQLAKENVPYGQTWTVETDLEKVKQTKEEREARKAKEDAERQEFIEKQHEKLKKAGEAPRCEHVYVDGKTCKGPQMRGERWCYNHKQMMTYRPGELTMAPLEDENALMLNILQIQRALITGRLSEKTAALLLYSMAIAAPSVAKVHKPEELSHSPDRATAARPGAPQGTQSTPREIGQEQNLETTEGTEETEEGKSDLPLMNTENT